MPDYSPSTVPWRDKWFTSVEFIGKITYIGNWGFAYCDGLQRMEIPDSVTSIGKQAFSPCYNLTYLKIPSSVTTIGYGAVSYCTKLTTVIISPGVISIGSEAFYYCSSLPNIEIPSTVTSIGSKAFSNCPKLQNIYVNPENKHYTSVNGVLYNFDKNELISFPNKKSTEYTVISSTKVIGLAAFSNSRDLTSVILPNGLLNISDEAFDNCYRLTSITIPSSVLSIRGWAFRSCMELISVYIRGNTILSRSSFEGSDRLKNVFYYGTVYQSAEAFSFCHELNVISVSFQYTYNLFCQIAVQRVVLPDLGPQITPPIAFSSLKQHSIFY